MANVCDVGLMVFCDKIDKIAPWMYFNKTWYCSLWCYGSNEHTVSSFGGICRPQLLAAAKVQQLRTSYKPHCEAVRLTQ